MIDAFLWFGFLLGLRHALEADHLAAVASFTTRSSAVGALARVAGVWGLGHGVVLLLVGLGVGLLDMQLPPQTDRAVSIIAGITLVLLGVDALRRFRKSIGVRHEHEVGLSGAMLTRALVVGGVHGLEGSAALVLVALPALHSTGRMLTFLGLFGLGAMLGMVACSLALTMPLRLTARLPVGARTVQLIAGGISVALGSWMAARATF